jgi:hypothetical protein
MSTHGRALHRAIRRHRARVIVQAMDAAVPWSAPVFAGMAVATPFVMQARKPDGSYDPAKYQAFVDRIANQPGLTEALEYVRDGLASLPPRED